MGTRISGERGTGRSLPRSELDIRAACNAGHFGPFTTLVPAAPGLPPTFEFVVVGQSTLLPFSQQVQGHQREVSCSVGG